MSHLAELGEEYQCGDPDGLRKLEHRWLSVARLLAGTRGRDRLLDDLPARLKPYGVRLLPEVHLADDKEVDIAARSAEIKLPIEIKLEAHEKLWTAPAAQLERLY